LSRKDFAPAPKPTHQSSIEKQQNIITYKTTNKTKNKKQVIGLLVSLKHNNFGIIYHIAKLGFLLSFIQKNVGHCF
jgi:hypothetical protein